MRPKDPKTSAIFEAALAMSDFTSFEQWYEAAEVARSTFYQIKYGQCYPQVDIALRICRAVDTTVEKLFGHVTPVKPSKSNSKEQER